MKIALLLIAIAAIAVSTSLAQSSNLVTSYTVSQSSNLVTSYTVFGNWLPVIFAACILAVLIATIHYSIGYILNSPRVKSSAVLEVQQAAGSILLVVLLVGIFYMVGTTQSLTFASILGSNGQSQISNICTYLGNSPLYIANSNLDDVNTGLPEPTTAVCKYLIQGASGSDPVTSNIDYGLAATYVIFANMTNQSAAEVNALYNFESVTFFLRNINPFIVICIPNTCENPLTYQFGDELKLAYKPYQGYVLHRTIMPTIVTQGVLALYMYLLQDVFALLVIIGWPYLLAAGIIMRTLPFTRRAGGLITAAVIVMVLIYPTINLIEYSALNNLSPVSYASGTASAGTTPFIGANQIPAVSLCAFGPVSYTGALGNNAHGTISSALYCYTDAASLKSSYVYKGLPEPSGTPATLPACKAPYSGSDYYSSGANPFNAAPSCYIPEALSFYSLPRAGDVVSFYSCYPTGLTIFPIYTEILTDTLLGTATLPIGIVLSLFSSTTSPLAPPSLPDVTAGTCLAKIAPEYLMAALDGLTNLYGIVSVTAFIIPIINALLMISAITGLSTLIGGEGTIIGLSRFI